jgi:hypothetical protein
MTVLHAEARIFLFEHFLTDGRLAHILSFNHLPPNGLL